MTATGPLHTQVTGEPAPPRPAPTRTWSSGGLSAGTTYYFAIKTADEVPNWSAISNCPTGTTMRSDTTAPAAVANLSCSNITATSVQLNWTAPGDNGSTGTATTYDIRYSTSTINAGNWASATQCHRRTGPGSGRHQPELHRQRPVWRYHLLLRHRNGRRSAQLVRPVQRAQRQDQPDTVAPAAVANLASAPSPPPASRSTWTAPGDNGSTGTATTYDIRYSTSAITTGNWASATQCTGEPAPAAAGTNQNFTVSGLSGDTTYYFAIETADEVPNWSGLSNVPSAKTSDTVAPAAVSNLATSSPTTSSIHADLDGPGRQRQHRHGHHLRHPVQHQHDHHRQLGHGDPGRG